MVDSKKFDEARKRRKYSYIELSEILGISRMSLYNKVHNIREFSANEANKLVAVLKLNQKERNEVFFAHEVELKSTEEVLNEKHDAASKKQYQC